MSRSLKKKSRLLLGLVNTPIKLESAQMVFYYGPSFSDCERYPITEARNILKHSKFDVVKKTVLYSHGYIEKLEDESIQVIVKAYLSRNDYNIIVLDWAELAEGNYILDAVINLKKFAPEVASVLIGMIEEGLPVEKLHLIGHSLGGQLSGFVGRNILEQTGQRIKIPRITALDPAFPGFYLFKFVKPLNRNDANFVDIIHTDAWLYGAPFRTGTADFWPNGGKTLQPGCPKRNYKMLSDIDLCSHRRSWWYWAESVERNKDDPAFNAVRAKSWKDFKRGIVENVGDDVVMGPDCPTNISGNFFLQTNGESPFARGLQGIKYLSRKAKDKKEEEYST